MKICENVFVMNNFALLNNEQVESRLAHVAPNECGEDLGHSEPQELLHPETEPEFSNQHLWALLGQIHTEIDPKLANIAKTDAAIEEKILRKY